MRNQKATVPTTTAADTTQPAYLMTHIEAALALSDLPAPAAQAIYVDNDEATPEEAHVPIIVRLVPDERDPGGPRSIVWSVARFEAVDASTGIPIKTNSDSYADVMTWAHRWQATHTGLLWRPMRRSDPAGVPTDGKAV